MAATNYTVIARNKETERIVLTNLVSKWTYKQALAIALEADRKSNTHDLICVIETSRILLKDEKENEEKLSIR